MATRLTVKLVAYFPDALNILLRTKNTRLKNVGDDPAQWTDEKKLEHLDYMLNTIQSSWEFAPYVFEIGGVSRAFTHQLVRTRTGSYAQESQRTVDVRGAGLVKPQAKMTMEQERAWDLAEHHAFGGYAALIDSGMEVQDARGILPTATSTSIFAKFDLRSLSDMAKVRLCVRTQGEYQRVFRLMRARVLEVHPWALRFIDPACVATGRCAFPLYGKKECPHWDPRMDVDELKRDVRAKFWANDIIHTANPKATAGRTM